MTRNFVIPLLTVFILSAGTFSASAQDTVKKATVSRSPATKVPETKKTGTGTAVKAPEAKKPAMGTTVKAPVAGKATLTKTPPATKPAPVPTVTAAPAAPYSAPADPSLNGQYRDMLMRSRTQNGFKIINQSRLTVLWNNAVDSLNSEKKKRVRTEQQLAGYKTMTDSLKSTISDHEETLGRTANRADQILLLGIPVDKSTYNLVTWGIVAVLALALVISLFQTSRYRKEAVYRIKLFEELTAEFQTYKTKANEREKKLARELQDERNKLDELRGGSGAL